MPEKFHFINPTKSNPCLACGGTDSKCRHTTVGVIFCGNSFIPHPPRGYRIGGIAADFWQMYHPTTEDFDEEQRAKWEAEQKRRKEESEKAEAEFQAKVLPPKRRHLQFSSLIGSIDIGEPAKNDLVRRQVSVAHATKWGIRSVDAGQDVSELMLSSALPGVAADTKTLSNRAGYIIPTKTPEGHITGFQVKVLEDGSYRWLSSKTGPADLPNHELPLTVCRPQSFVPTSNAAIGMCEGILKPFIAAQLMNQVVVGAAGGMFASSPETLKRYLAQLHQEMYFQHILFYPDAGSIINPHMLAQYGRVWRLLGQWGYSLKILWYGQQSKHDYRDIDEMTLHEVSATNATLITEHDFWGKSKGIAKGELARLIKSLGFKSKSEALRAVRFTGTLDRASALTTWRAVMALQDYQEIIRLESQVDEAIAAADDKKSLIAKIAQSIAPYGGTVENGKVSNLAKKHLRNLIEEFDSLS